MIILVWGLLKEETSRQKIMVIIQDLIMVIKVVMVMMTMVMVDMDMMIMGTVGMVMTIMDMVVMVMMLDIKEVMTMVVMDTKVMDMIIRKWFTILLPTKVHLMDHMIFYQKEKHIKVKRVSSVMIL